MLPSAQLHDRIDFARPLLLLIFLHRVIRLTPSPASIPALAHDLRSARGSAQLLHHHLPPPLGHPLHERPDRLNRGRPQRPDVHLELRDEPRQSHIEEQRVVVVSLGLRLRFFGLGRDAAHDEAELDDALLDAGVIQRALLRV